MSDLKIMFVHNVRQRSKFPMEFRGSALMSYKSAMTWNLLNCLQYCTVNCRVTVDQTVADSFFIVPGYVLGMVVGDATVTKVKFPRRA
jgi:hypothetical protein